MSNRRDFLRQISAASVLTGFGAFPMEAFAKKDIVKITVLHTNDVHSRIDPFPDNDPKFGGKGGVAQRAAIINQIRNEEKNILLLDAGDIFQGTPYFNMYGGELEMKLMSQMGYDASTIGNHDFDNGMDGLLKQLPHAKFPLINCNYDFTETVLHGQTIPYKVFEKEGIRIGVFGLGIELDGLVDKKLFGKTIYNDPLVKAAEYTYRLKHDEKCDIIICLSHLGYQYADAKVSDVILAKKSSNIDLIIGGHTHTFIDTPNSYYNRDGKQVLVAQVGWAGIKLGRIDFYVEKKLRKKIITSSTQTIGVQKFS